MTLSFFFDAKTEIYKQELQNTYMYQQCGDWITEEKNVLVLQNLIRKHRQNSFPPSHKFFLFHIIQSDTLRYYEQVDNKIIFSESIKSTFIVKRGKVPSINYVDQFLDFLNPPSPHVDFCRHLHDPPFDLHRFFMTPPPLCS